MTAPVSAPPEPKPRLRRLVEGVPHGPWRWKWALGVGILALLGYTVLLPIPGSFVVPAGVWTAFVVRRAGRDVDAPTGDAADSPVDADAAARSGSRSAVGRTVKVPRR